MALQMAAATSECVLWGFLCLYRSRVRSTYKFPEGDEPSLLCCFVLCGFSLPLLMVLIPQLCVIYL